MILGQPYCIGFAFNIFVFAEYGCPNTTMPLLISLDGCLAISDGLYLHNQASSIFPIASSA